MNKIPDIAGLCKNGSPLIMGVVNVTPDSFSDGGRYYSVERAVSHGMRLLEEGADILDIGGESTRPNARAVSIEEEIERVIPVIDGLADAGVPIISVDTRNSKTMRAAIDVGANFINDISGLLCDNESVTVVADSGLPVCVMHMQGTPENMQDNPDYGSVVDDILEFFCERINFCNDYGIDRDKIILDPGVGFGKTVEHNLQIIKNIDVFCQLGCTVLLGASRKSFIGRIAGESIPENRVAGSIASVLCGTKKGARIFRVHDVKETKQALEVYKAIEEA